MRLAMIAAIAALALPVLAETPTVTPTPPSADDPYLWLEDIHGARSMAWVEQQNVRSLAVLKGDARYEAFHQDALFPLDRTGQLIFWLAFDDMTPDHWERGLRGKTAGRLIAELAARAPLAPDRMARERTFIQSLFRRR